MPEHATHVRVHELDTLGALAALAPEWERLWRACPDATVFQSPAWLIPWWRHLGRGRPCALAVRVGERLVGLLPLTVNAGSPQARLRLAGAGVSDYLGGVFAAEARRPAIAAALAHLRRRCEPGTRVELEDLRDDSPLLHASLPSGLDVVEPENGDCPRFSGNGDCPRFLVHENCPALALPDGATDAGACVPHGMYSRLQRERRRATRSGAMRIERATAETIPEIAESLFRLHGMRWSERGEDGVLHDPATRAFHLEAMRGLARQGLLVLCALRLDDRIAAVYYGFCDPPRARRDASSDRARCAYCYISGFDPAFRRASPGTLLIGHAIEDALREGATIFDFLRGTEPYKHAWGARDRRTYRVSLQVARPRRRLQQDPARTAERISDV